MDTSTGTPTGVVNRAIKSDIENDYGELLSLFSERLKASYGSLDSYKSGSEQLRAEFDAPRGTQIVQEPGVKGANLKVLSENDAKAKVHYSVYYSRAPFHGGSELADDIDLMKERGAWKIDSLSFPIMASKESRESNPLYDFSAIPENYDSPEAAILTWAKYVHGGDIPGVWRTYSQRLKADSWNNDFSAFQVKYSQEFAKHGEPTNVTNFKVMDEHRVVQSMNVYKYTVDYLPTSQTQDDQTTTELFLIKDGNQWKVDSPPFFVFF